MWNIVLLGVFLLWPLTAMAANQVYVAKTGGRNSYTCKQAESQLTPKQTINGAMSCMTTPGKVMYIKPGTYQEELDTLTKPIVGGNGPTYTNATRIEGIGTGAVIIQSPIVTSWITMRVHHANDKFLVFKNLTFDAAGRAGMAVIVYGPAHHIRFENVTIRNALPYDNVLISGASNVELIDTTVTGNGSAGISLSGTIDPFLCLRCHLGMTGGKGFNIQSGGTKSNISIMNTSIAK